MRASVLYPPPWSGTDDDEVDGVGLRGEEKDAAELAARLFKYLGGVERLRAQTAPTASNLIREGKGLWFHELPQHEAVADNRTQPEGPVLEVKKPAKLRAPKVGENIEDWIKGPLDRPGWEPKVRSEILTERLSDGSESDDLHLLKLSDLPEIKAEADLWLETWRVWASEDIRTAPIRKLYRLLEEMMLKVEARPNDYEIVVELGCLSFMTSAGARKTCHVVRVPAALSKAESGDLRLTLTGPGIFDVDAVPATSLPAPERVKAARDAIEGVTERPTDPDNLTSALKAFTYHLPGDASFVNSDALPSSIDNTFLAWAPAVSLRPIDPSRHLATLETVSELARNEGAPEALVPGFVGQDSQSPDETGSVIEIDGETLTNGTFSSAQLRALRHSGTGSPTVVMYEHGANSESVETAGAIVQHLLALGRRVLITGESPDRLEAIAATLPASLKAMVVDKISKTGSNELGGSVAGVVQAIEEFGGLYSVDEADIAEADLLSEIGLLLDQLEEQNEELLSLRIYETKEHEIHEVVGTIPRIADWHAEAETEFGWLEISPEVAQEQCPISSADFGRWLRLMRNQLSEPDLEQFSDVAPTAGLVGIATTDEFSALLGLTGSPINRDVTNALDDVIVDMDSADRRALLGELRTHIDTVKNSELAAHVDEEIVDPTNGYFHAWTARQAQIAVAMGQIHATHSKWSHLPVALSMDLDSAIESAETILEYLGRGRPLKLDENGVPRIGFGTPRVLKENAEFFEKVQVAGRPAAESEQLVAFLEGASAWRLLDEVDGSWPAGTPVPTGSSVSERLAWHDIELSKLNAILESATRLRRLFESLYNQGFPTGNEWHTIADIQPFISELEAVDRVYRQAEAQVELGMLAERVEKLKADPDARNWSGPLHVAVQERNADNYRAALDRRLGMLRWDAQMNWVGEVRSQLRPHAPQVVAAMEANPTDPVWDDRAARFHEAWRWAAVGAWLAENQPPSPVVIARRIEFIDEQLRATVAQVVHIRSWRGALVRSESLAEFQRTGEEAVPAWVATIGAIPDELTIAKDSFDVVVVDDASNTGLHSLFLQFLAPKLVVLGDGIQRGSAPGDPAPEELRALAEGLLPDSYQLEWTRPETSLFDDMAWRFQNVIALSDNPRPGSKPVLHRYAEEEAPELLSDGDLDITEASPFDSLFEQRVFNRLTEDGFTVETQTGPGDHDINLLVHGQDDSLAIDISDDRWQGPEAHAEQVQSRRLLEDAGWILHQISEVQYTSDPYKALAGLRRRLTALNIAPVVEEEEPVEEVPALMELQLEVPAAKAALFAGAGVTSEEQPASLGDTQTPDDSISSEGTDLFLIPEEPHVIDLTGATGVEAFIEPAETEPEPDVFETEPEVKVPELDVEELDVEELELDVEELEVEELEVEVEPEIEELEVEELELEVEPEIEELEVEELEVEELELEVEPEIEELEVEELEVEELEVEDLEVGELELQVEDLEVEAELDLEEPELEIEADAIEPALDDAETDELDFEPDLEAEAIDPELVVDDLEIEPELDLEPEDGFELEPVKPEIEDLDLDFEPEAELFEAETDNVEVESEIPIDLDHTELDHTDLDHTDLDLDVESDDVIDLDQDNAANLFGVRMGPYEHLPAQALETSGVSNGNGLSAPEVDFFPRKIDSEISDVEPVATQELFPRSRDVNLEEPQPEAGFLFSASNSDEALHAENSEESVEPVAGFNPAAFARYVEWVPARRFSADALIRTELMEIVTSAVAVEGPIMVDRLYRLIMKKSSSGRLNRKMRGKLDEALQAAEVGGLLVIDRPTENSPLDEGWASAPGEIPIARRIGPRKLAEVPPPEVVAALDSVDDGSGEAVRKLANKWNLGRLNLESKRYLNACEQLRSERS